MLSLATDTGGPEIRAVFGAWAVTLGIIRGFIVTYAVTLSTVLYSVSRSLLKSLVANQCQQMSLSQIGCESGISYGS